MIRQALLAYANYSGLMYGHGKACMWQSQGRHVGVHTNVGGMVALPVSASKNMMCSLPNNVAYVAVRIWLEISDRDKEGEIQQKVFMGDW